MVTAPFEISITSKVIFVKRLFLANAFLIGGENVGVIEDVLSYVDRQIGKSYSQSNRYGENSFDCSSLVYRAFEAAGVKLVHKDTGGKVDVSSNECYAKDFELIYPESYSKKGNFFHALHEKWFVPFTFVFFQHFRWKLLCQNTHKRERDSLIW